MRWIVALTVSGCVGLICFSFHSRTDLLPAVRGAAPASELPAESLDRSPIDLALSADGSLLATANCTSGSVSLVSLDDRRVLGELSVGGGPQALAFLPDGRLLVTVRDPGLLLVLECSGDRLTELARIEIGFQPYGVAAAPDGKTAYVACFASGDVAVADLASNTVQQRIAVGRWPRYLALSADGTRLAVGCSGDGGVSVINTAAGEVAYQERFEGLNLGQMQVSADGQYAHVAWVTYSNNPITPDNIRRGWVTGTRLGRIRLDTKKRREAITLDVPGRAVGDPMGLALTPDERWVAVSAGGTHELLLFQAGGLPYQDFGGPGDHMDYSLSQDSTRFARIDLGGRPQAVRIDGAGRHAYVANYLLNCVQIVDLTSRSLVGEIDLGGPAEPSLARQGEAIFLDARRSLDSWYSCQTCHYEGGSNSVRMDTLNDGTPFTYKTVLPLYELDQTGPWTWHGWQQDLPASIRKSLMETMQGPEPSDDDVAAVVAYLSELQLPPNPYRGTGAEAEAAAERGQELFQSARAGCSICHSGTYFTDGQIHDLGLGSPADFYVGYNTPSLLGVYRRVRFLHDGRSKSLEELLRGPHSPDKVSQTAPLTEEELVDLTAYLRSL